MKLSRSSSVLEYRLVSSFNNVRGKLLSEKYRDRLDKPLAYWALPNDRRLPLAFMGRSLKSLLDTPFEELYATPGIGQKKIGSLVELLQRAAKEQPHGAIPPPEENIDEETLSAISKGVSSGEPIDPSVVSEALWVRWRETVGKHDVGRDALGRYAVSLQELPRVIWHTPLDAYTGLTLAEIRALKTHGEKRVRAVLEIFGSLHAILAHVGRQNHLDVVIMPRFVRRLESWVTSVMRREELPTPEEIRESFIDPLIVQLRIDAGEQITRLAESRLALRGAGASVRQSARKMGLTRARVYQLLNDVSAIADVRWPQGQALVGQLRARLQAESSQQDELQTFYATVDLFFPGSRDASAFELTQDGDADADSVDAAMNGASSHA